MHPVKVDGPLKPNFLIHPISFPQYETRYSNKIKHLALVFQFCEIKGETTQRSRKANACLYKLFYLIEIKIS